MNPQASIVCALASLLGGAWSALPLHGSGFCATWRAHQSDLTLFVKSLPIASAPILEAEADGLAALAATRTLRVPQVVACAADRQHDLAVLALEWLELRSADMRHGERFGNALAALHLAAPPGGSGCYGWHRDNMLGGTPQRNRWSGRGATEGWIEFYRRQRLGAMRERLAASGGGGSLVDAVDAVIDALPRFFADGHVPRPSLIHGDLWQGNWGMLADGTPVIYDPAVSCSDAEAELAMMELFGTAPANFWDAYRKRAGLHEGYSRRRGLYQLYHLLNHALLFGGGYLRQCELLARALSRS